MKPKILIEYIEKSGKSHKFIADKIGVTQQQFYWMVRHPMKLRPDQIKAIADAVDRSPRNLFSLIISNQMKKLLIIIACAISFASCRKCADCTTTVTTKVTGQQPAVGTSKSEMCGDELKEADGYTSTSTATVNGHTATITVKTTCL